MAIQDLNTVRIKLVVKGKDWHIIRNRFFITGPKGYHVLVVIFNIVFLFLHIVWLVFVTPYYIKNMNVIVPIICFILGILAWYVYFIM